MSCIQGQSRTAAACVGRGRGCWWGLITLGKIIRESRICDGKSDSSGLDTHWLRIGTCSVCLNYKISLFRVVFWDILPCKMIVDRRFRGAYCLLMMEAVCTSETSLENNFTRQSISEDNSEQADLVIQTNTTCANP
jgi:hypothetical protein